MAVDYKQQRIRSELRMVWLAALGWLALVIGAWLLTRQLWPHNVLAQALPIIVGGLGASALGERRRRIRAKHRDPVVVAIVAVLALATLATFFHILTG